MTTSSSSSTDPSASAGLVLSTSAGLVPSVSAGLVPSASAGLVPSPSAGPLMPFVQDMTKPLYIGKPVIGANNTTALMYTKGTLWIGGVPFPSLDEAWRYMLGIPDQSQRLEIAKDVAHQQVLLGEKVGCEHENMARLLKRDWKSVGMARQTMTDLIGRLHDWAMIFSRVKTRNQGLGACLL